MTSMTYGTLPSRADFDSAYEAECPEGYYVKLNGRDADLVDWALEDVEPHGVWDADETWSVLLGLVRLWESDDVYAGDVAGELASSILTTLGFEWV